MIEFLKKENKTIFFLFVFFVLNLSFFFLKQGSLTVDVGREFYIPWQMLKDQVLYKDIFNIYGPLSYQINSLAYMFFGQKISTLCTLGAINSFVVLISIFYISREFLCKTFSFLITILVAYACIFSVGLFNFNLPYSFAIIYGFSSFLLSILFLIKYSKEEKPIYSYLACLFAGFSISCKYEYVLYTPLILYVIAFLKPIGVKNVLRGFAIFCFFPLVSFGTLFLQGLNIEDLRKSLSLIKTMSQAESIKYLYTYFSGTFFNLKIFQSVIKNFSYLAGVFFILFCYGTFKEKAKTKQKENFYFSIFFLLTFFLVCYFKLYLGFGFLPMFLFILFCCFYKLIFKEPSEFILYVSAIISSLKTFFALNLFVYGVFTFPLVLLGVVVFLRKTLLRISNSEQVIESMRTSLLFLLSSFVLYFGFVDFNSLQYKQSLLSTKKGSIYGGKETVATYSGLIDFIENNTKIEDKVVILPETPFVNFLTSRESDNFYHSLIPLYFETFGEENIINHFREIKPEYIVINNRDTSDYGYKYMCEDYALDFCSYVKENYSSVKIIENKYKAQIYKRKDLK